MQTMAEAAGAFAYPGRGIVIGLSPEGDRAILAYFIMGRSENSRNRVFVPDGEGIRTEAHDPSKLMDPSLIIYAPVRVLGDTTIVTNGDQTDTVYEALRAGGSFEEALKTRTYEPDGPHYTPRISGMAEIMGGKLRYRLSILRRGEDGACERPCFEYPAPVPGTGHFIHTYDHDGDPLPSFRGEPRPVAIGGSLAEMANALWNALHSENRVALFLREIELATGRVNTRIINQKENPCAN